MIEDPAFGLHDAILLAVCGAAVYIGVAFAQLIHLKRKPPARAIARDPSLEPRYHAETGLSADSEEQARQTPAAHMEHPVLVAALQRLSCEIELLRTTISATRVDMEILRAERNVPNPVVHNSEALSLAKLGFGASSIAMRCGITPTEAELLVTLVREPKEYEAVADVKALAGKENNHEILNRYRAAA